MNNNLKSGFSCFEQSEKPKILEVKCNPKIVISIYHKELDQNRHITGKFRAIHYTVNT